MSSYSEAIRLTGDLGPCFGSVALRDVTVRDAMRPGAMTCRADTPVRTVAQAMVCHHVTAMSVRDLDDDGNALRRPAKDVTHLDIVKAAQEDRLDEPIGDVVDRPVISIDANESLEVAMGMMVRYGAQHLIVIDAESNLPIGALSASDVSSVIAFEPAAAPVT